MHKNFVWLGFLSLITGAVGWFTLKTLYTIYLYTLLNVQVPAQDVTWSVEQLSSDQYVLKANYKYETKGEKQSGETLFKNDIFFNPWAAENSINVYASKDWVVWYSSYYPQYSSLQKNFPLKESISAIILWVIMFYFFGLGFYVAKRKH